MHHWALDAAPETPLLEPAMTASALDLDDNPRPIVTPVADVRLWWCELDRMPVEAAALSSWLSASESARAARFGAESLRRRWIAGRAALRYVLAAHLGIAPPEVPIRRGARGRPELAEPEATLDFNVSHTGGVALIGVLAGDRDRVRIGVDVERRDRAVGAERLGRKFLTPRERAAHEALSIDERRLRFLRSWTCKEAMSKATGDGLIAPFGSLDLDLDPELRLLDGPSPSYSPSAWRLYVAAVPPECLGTVALWRCPP
jgi:4'-phosphopantetheinyl transferase